jgi:hypothetical protein
MPSALDQIDRIFVQQVPAANSTSPEYRMNHVVGGHAAKNALAQAAR